MFLVPTRRFPSASRCGNELDQLFRSVFGSAPFRAQWPSSSTLPAMSVWEDEGHLFVEVEVPGFREDDLDVSVVGSELTIKGEREDVEQKDATYHHHERRQESFARTLALPVEVDADRVEASLKHGVLLLKLAKSEAAKPRKIGINTEE